jgi:hypothetical protein
VRLVCGAALLTHCSEPRQIELAAQIGTKLSLTTKEHDIREPRRLAAGFCEQSRRAVRG